METEKALSANELTMELDPSEEEHASPRAEAGLEKDSSHRVCPWWLGYLFLSPLRKWMENPARVLRPHVKPGMRAVDVGCAMGFFSLPLAEQVGPKGTVVCVDLQEKMISRLIARARRAGMRDRIDARTCTANSLGLRDLDGTIDFVLAYHVVHEVPDAGAHFRELHRLLKPCGVLLYVEPQGHVKKTEFARLFRCALAAGFTCEPAESPALKRNHSALLRRP